MSHPIKALIKQADEAIAQQDFKKLMDFYADDAILVVKPGVVARGKEQIQTGVSSDFGVLSRRNAPRTKGNGNFGSRGHHFSVIPHNCGNPTDDQFPIPIGAEGHLCIPQEPRRRLALRHR